MREKLTCYIIDDEYLARQILERYVAKVSFLELKGSFGSPLDAASQMDKDRPNLLFLDINMPDLDGLSFIPMLNPKPMIILTTAYGEFALKAFDLDVKDYLLKPISFERFYTGILRLYQDVNLQQQPQKLEEQIIPEKEQEYIFVKVGFSIQQIAVRDILFIEGMKDYLRIHTTKEKFMTLLSFAKLEELLPDKKFVRVHRSFMVSLEKIGRIEKKSIRIDEKIIPIGNTYSDTLFNMLRDYRN